MRWIALVLIAAMFAGCTGEETSSETLYACRDGVNQVDLATVSGNEAPGFDPESACPQKKDATIAITKLPATLGAYRAGTLTWALVSGDYEAEHSMLSVVRASTTPVSDADMAKVAKPEDYGTMTLDKREHQNLPADFTMELQIAEPGTYYIRAVGRIVANGVPESLFWTPEYKLEVTPVQPSGTTHTITHAVGDFAGGLTPATLQAALGDAVILKNDDVRSHVFSFTAPTAAPIPDVTVGAQSSSEAIVLLAPGAYKVTSDDVVAQTTDIQVTA